MKKSSEKNEVSMKKSSEKKEVSMKNGEVKVTKAEMKRTPSACRPGTLLRMTSGYVPTMGKL